jgi:predicted nuclease with TOPRIM domain
MLTDEDLLNEINKLLAKQEKLQTEWQEEASILIAEKFKLLGQVNSLRRQLKELTAKTADTASG